MTGWQLPRDPLLALREGDPAPFEDFVRSHARTLIAFFRGRGATLPRAEDLTQEVFVKLYQNAPRYAPEERFAAFCFRVARNVWIDDCRRRSLRRDVAAGANGEEDGAPAGEELAAPLGDPLRSLELEDQEKRLAALLAGLPASHRAVFELAVLGELSYAEIASILSIPVGTVKSRMFHAVRKLRLALGEAGPDEGVA